MYDIETQNKFVELRSLGNSYESISKTLNLSKNTLIKWNKRFEAEILELKKIGLEEIKEKFLTAKNHRIELLSEVFGELKSQIKEQPVLMNYQKLVMLLMKISQYFDRTEFADFKMSYFLNQKTNNEKDDQNSDDSNITDKKIANYS